jgi:uncharacterized membrane protein
LNQFGVPSPALTQTGAIKSKLFSSDKKIVNLSRAARSCLTVINGPDQKNLKHPTLAEMCVKHPTLTPLLAGLLDAVKQQLGTVSGILVNLAFFLFGLLTTVLTGGVALILKLLAVAGMSWAIVKMLAGLYAAMRQYTKSKKGSIDRAVAVRAIGSVGGGVLIMVLMALIGFGVGKTKAGAATIKSMESGLKSAMTELGIMDTVASVNKSIPAPIISFLSKLLGGTPTREVIADPAVLKSNSEILQGEKFRQRLTQIKAFDEHVNPAVTISQDGRILHFDDIYHLPEQLKQDLRAGKVARVAFSMQHKTMLIDRIADISFANTAFTDQAKANILKSVEAWNRSVIEHSEYPAEMKPPKIKVSWKNEPKPQSQALKSKDVNGARKRLFEPVGKRLTVRALNNGEARDYLFQKDLVVKDFPTIDVDRLRSGRKFKMPNGQKFKMVSGTGLHVILKDVKTGNLLKLDLVQHIRQAHSYKFEIPGSRRLYPKQIIVTIPALRSGRPNLVSLKLIERAFKRMPPEALEGLDEITVNPQHNHNPKITAIAIPNRIDFYPDALRGPTAVNLLNTLRHELGHIKAHHYLGSMDPGVAWDAAIKADGVSVSKYGDTSPDEDFAEAVALYLGTNGGMQMPSLLAKYPNRFKMLDKVFGVDSMSRQQVAAQLRSKLAGVGVVIAGGSTGASILTPNSLFSVDYNDYAKDKPSLRRKRKPGAKKILTPSKDQRLKIRLNHPVMPPG